MDKCCNKCFQDSAIIEYILSNGEDGNCPICGSLDAKVISLKKLGNYFRERISKAYESIEDGTGAIYDSDEKIYTGAYGEEVEGESIYDILIQDMEIFSPHINASELLKSIFNSSAPTQRDIQKGEIDDYPDIYDKSYVFKDSLYGVEASDEFYEWEEFKHLTMYYNRYFDVDEDKDKNGRNQLLDEISIIFPAMEENLEKNSILFRARMMETLPESFSTIDYYKEISPAPPQFASSNRMSPQGISYTYLATNPETCYKECRMKQGDYALVGKFVIKRNLKILNLSSKKTLYVKNSIFSEHYRHGLAWINDFINMFSMDISKIINSKDKDIEYVPTQVIAEYIRSKGYDGIKFESSVNKGSYNYTLFCGPNKEISKEFYPSWYTTLLMNKDLIYFTRWIKLIDIKWVAIISDNYKDKLLYNTKHINRSDIVTEVDGISTFDCLEEIEERLHNLEQHLIKEYKPLFIEGKKINIEKFVRSLLEEEDGVEHHLSVSKTFGWLSINIDKKEFSFEDIRGGDYLFNQLLYHR
jgi:hypothetical protein